MINREEYLETIRREMAVATHLYGKLDPARLDWRPAEGMRSTLELLRYLSHCGSTPVEAILGNDWTLARARAERAATMPAEEFPQRMEAQARDIAKRLEGVPDADFQARTVALPWGESCTLGAALVGTSVRFLAAYRLQLFLHAKATGASQLNTYNAWLGIDPPPAA